MALSSTRRSFSFVSLAFATLVAGPGTARADSGWLFGFSAGGLYTDGPAPPELAFRIGLGPDWVFDSGLTFLGRLETTHLLDTNAHLGIGWSGPGLLTDQGLPLGLGLGPIVSLDRTGDLWGGGRGSLRWSLWYARALLELDLGLARRFDPNGQRDDDAWELRLGLGLRLVPF